MQRHQFSLGRFLLLANLLGLFIALLVKTRGAVVLVVFLAPLIVSSYILAVLTVDWMRGRMARFGSKRTPKPSAGKRSRGIRRRQRKRRFDDLD